jgi:hypothetical protein
MRRELEFDSRLSRPSLVAARRHLRHVGAGRRFHGITRRHCLPSADLVGSADLVADVVDHVAYGG